MLHPHVLSGCSTYAPSVVAGVRDAPLTTPPYHAPPYYAQKLASTISRAVKEELGTMKAELGTISKELVSTPLSRTLTTPLS